MSKFDLLHLEGLFYKDSENVFWVKPDDGPPERVYSALMAFVGKGPVHLVMHYLPSVPPDPQRWGGGCCMWQSSGHCPAGHHRNPGYLLHLSETGILQNHPDYGWSIEDSSGEELPLTNSLNELEGHMGRILVVPILNLRSQPDLASVEAMSTKAEELRDLLNRFCSVVKEK